MGSPLRSVRRGRRVMSISPLADRRDPRADRNTRRLEARLLTVGVEFERNAGTEEETLRRTPEVEGPDLVALGNVLALDALDLTAGHGAHADRQEAQEADGGVVVLDEDHAPRGHFG